MSSVHFLKPAAIACASAKVFSRKITPASAIKYTGIGVCIRYKCERDSSAEIIKELNPKICSHDASAYLDLGDKIRGKTVVVWVKGIKPSKTSKGSNYSGTHSIGYFDTDAYTYAELALPFPDIQNGSQKRIGSS